MKALFAVAVGLLFGLMTAPVGAQPAGSVLRWEMVGHIADQPISWLAVPADGLQSGVLYARSVAASNTYVMDATNGKPSPGTTYRSQDGGKTWTAVADAPGYVALSPGGSTAFSLAKDALYRSTDNGATWTQVAPFGATRLLFSPAFAQDGTAFAVGSDQLWRTTDHGASWSNLDPGQGQLVVDARLSPNFASDHTLWSAAITARPAAHGADPPPTDNADSAGLLVSHDAGSTWTSLSDGLQTDDGPYHQVLAFGVSPNFASDQTLYVTSIGPWLPSSPANLCRGCPLPNVATFVSNDAGMTWQVVNQPSINVYALGSSLSVSPGFGADQTLLSTVSVGGASPSSYGCEPQGSSDAGASWQALSGKTISQGMCGMGIVSAGGTPVLLVYQQPYYLSSAPNRNVMRSTDGGATWATLSPPGDALAPGFQADLAQRQVLLTDRVLQATSRGDLWAYGAFQPCDHQPVLGFGQVWSQHADWQESAGCPTGPEQPVQVQASHDAAQNADTYWTGGANAVCVRVTSDGNGNPHGSVLQPGKDCGGAGDQVLAGSLLTFPNGQYWLYVPTPTGPGQGLVLTSHGGVATVTS